MVEAVVGASQIPRGLLALIQVVVAEAAEEEARPRMVAEVVAVH